MFILNRNEDILGPSPLMRLVMPPLVCLHGHARRDDRISPIVVRHAITCGFCMNLLEPNLRPNPILTGLQAVNYRRYMRKLCQPHRTPGHRWLMTIQITKDTTRAMIRHAYHKGIRVVKYYPLGVTTNSGNGVSGWWEQIMAPLEEMALICQENPNEPMVLQVHAEEGFEPDGVTPLDPWMREYRALEKVRWLALRLPKLVISFEHVSTDGAVDLGVELPNLLLSISIVHMTLTKDDVVHDHKLHPHCWCAPVAKDEASRKRLVEAATGQIVELADRTHLGLDYAPHLLDLKEAKEWVWPPAVDGDLPPMGAYSLPEAVPLLVALFERTVPGGPDVWLSRLLQFGRFNGPRNYGVKLPNRRKIELVREPWLVPHAYLDLQGRPTVRSFMAGREISWRVVGAKL